MEFVLGSFNGVVIEGKRPRRPKMRKGLGGRAPSLYLKPPDNQLTKSSGKQRQLESTFEQNNISATPTSNGTPVLLGPPSASVYRPSTSNDDDDDDEENSVIRSVVQRLNDKSNNRWSVEHCNEQEYRIHFHSIHDLFDFTRTLGQLSLNSPIQSQLMAMNYLSTLSSIRLSNHDVDDLKGNNDNDVQHASSSRTDQKQVQKWGPVILPYIHFHSELYVESTFMKQQEWPRFMSILPVLLDDCVHTFITCMNHYFPVRPRRLLVQWYSSLPDPSADPLVLSIASFWVRHVFIHHPMAQLKHIFDPTILDTVQSKLAQMARSTLADCFDQPHVHHIYALCLCNMTTALPLRQKATNHMLAVRMAAALGIQPLRASVSSANSLSENDEAELGSRLWWYLFQIDHFLTESGTITSSLLNPPSDDYEALSRLQLPTICALDETDEQAGVHVWSNVLKIWMIRRRVTKTIESVDPLREDQLTHIYDGALQEIDQWSRELPDMLQPEVALDPEHFSNLAEACLTVSMERCTDVALISLRLLPRDGRVLTQLQRRAVLKMIDSSIELITTRQSVVAFAPCQTWPGDLKRSVEMLMSCLKYGDPTVASRSRIGLMRAARMLRTINEVRWHDHICTAMLTKIEDILSVTETTLCDVQQQGSSSACLQAQRFSSSHSPPSSAFMMDTSTDTSSADQHSWSTPLHTQVDEAESVEFNAGNMTITDSIIAADSSKSFSSDSPEQQQQSRKRQERFTLASGNEKPTLKMSNNLYEGVMMLDRDMQPRSQYYNPNSTSHNSFDDLLVFEDIRRYATP